MPPTATTRRVPEGDSIHRLAARLRPVVGRAITSAVAKRLSNEACASLVGRAVVAVEARGKNLLVHLDDGRALHVHLKMLGRVSLVDRAAERSRAAYRTMLGARAPAVTPDLRLELGELAVVGSSLPVVRLLRDAARAPDLAGLGPDLLGPTFDEAAAIERLRARPHDPIGVALMRQSAVAGIGNVYKSEVLFLQGVDPRRPISELDDDALAGLLRRARGLLQKNLGPGPRVTRSSLRGKRHWVYGRAGEPCFSCGSPIERIHQRAADSTPRTTDLCPRCQRDGGLAARRAAKV